MSNNDQPIVFVDTSSPSTLGESFLMFFDIIKNLTSLQIVEYPVLIQEIVA